MSAAALQNLFLVLILLGAALAAAGAYGYNKIKDDRALQKDRTAAMSGKINPSSTDARGEDLVIRVGQIEFSVGDGRLPFLRDLQIGRENGQLWISTVIRDRSGDIVAEIVRNEWRINPGRSFDRNYNSSALEVRGSRGDILLKVRFDGDAAEVQGVFNTLEGRTIAVTESGEGAAIHVADVSGNFRVPVEISPMFVYPSATHLGELRGR